ncbi:MAG: hypothetical protein VX433_05200, partial [Candidatus Thermoplasmatota archaeon]|nr:hypothetical protein [Candidatus Thermoplasmatota archaeon]
MLGVRTRSVLLSAMMLLVGQMLLIQNYAPQPSVLDEFVEARSSGTAFTGNGTQWQIANAASFEMTTSPHLYPISNDSFLFTHQEDADGNCFKRYSHSNLTAWNVAVTSGDTGFYCPSSGSPWLQFGPTIESIVYISTQSNGVGTELFAYNITNNTLYLVEDIITGASSSTPFYLVAIGSVLFFTLLDQSSSTGNELWAYNTTNSTSWLVADINPGAGHGYPYYILPIGTSIVFVANDGTNGSTGNKELWTYETTNDSYWRVSDINPSGNGLNKLDSRYSAVLGTRLMFWADDDGATGNELWAYETTNTTHWQVADINSGPGDSYSGYLITRDGSRMYFSAEDGIN